MKLSENFFIYFTFILFILFLATSYFRFVVKSDYLVAYESDCNPLVNSCFIGCDDDECTSKYYYKEIKKYAANLEKQCGADITDCELANICLPNEQDTCSITFCNPDTDEECYSLNEPEMNQVDGNMTGNNEASGSPNIDNL